MIKLLTPLITTGLFLVIASYSYGKLQAPYDYKAHSYVQTAKNNYAKAKPVIIHRLNKEKLIAEVWNIKPGELSQPVNIFGE